MFVRNQCVFSGSAQQQNHSTLSFCQEARNMTPNEVFNNGRIPPKAIICLCCQTFIKSNMIYMIIYNRNWMSKTHCASKSWLILKYCFFPELEFSESFNHQLLGFTIWGSFLPVHDDSGFVAQLWHVDRPICRPLLTLQLFHWLTQSFNFSFNKPNTFIPP